MVKLISLASRERELRLSFAFRWKVRPMKLKTTSILLAACCWWTLTTPACALLGRKAAPTPLAGPPKPVGPAEQPVEIAADLPISVPQTQVTLPSPQPVQDEALSVVKPEAPPAPLPNQTAKPPRAAPPKAEQRQPATAATAPTTPAGAQPPPASRPRFRPVESAEERQRLTAQIATRQRQVQDNLAKARSRRL